MGARENVLREIQDCYDKIIPLPAIDLFNVVRYDSIVSQFSETSKAIGTVVFDSSSMEEVQKEMGNDKNGVGWVVNTVEALGSVDSDCYSVTAKDLRKVEKLYIEAMLGVAENGAVWLSESKMGNRLLPFICQHLVVVLNKKNIVHTMHHAYLLMDAGIEKFGVFVAGPSKTADIEQSLVVGAHGAKSTTVYLID